ncbi:hypothetical protein NG798_00535 [Ancylothrix sp. C2]|uniref:hypothetical protein n=1 Tax=Ancylothrix sp. D3o TaxID=2953691 RepID=UPI0021BB63C5|nr:hypothetical protein [Ancylothrix sp. D3o]MCT7948279.1 hypothetical protein [Ancylothrix sp. D3o]
MLEQIKRDLIASLVFKLNLPVSADQCFECEILREYPPKCRFMSTDGIIIMDFDFSIEVSLDALCLPPIQEEV